MLGDRFANAEGGGNRRARLDYVEAHFWVFPWVDEAFVFVAPDGDVEEGGEEVFGEVASFCEASAEIVNDLSLRGEGVTYWF